MNLPGIRFSISSVALQVFTLEDPLLGFHLLAIRPYRTIFIPSTEPPGIIQVSYFNALY
jgi:hypothetical protein